ncbi:prepilin-type N-terminal cleavage/methylation domain-containing protein [Patescibacteria group bacterium]|nr:prepilin-type N-terminal cleavage/methylation domain-containing protein [Patescibacteria group bacterium]
MIIRNFKKIQLRQSGFTVVEMVVVLIILVVILSVILINFRKGERIEEFRLATQHLASNLRMAQTSALTGLAEEESLGQRYGVHFDSTAGNDDQYVLFKDNYTLDYGENDVIIEIFNLPLEITISELLIDDLPTNNLDVVFNPPKPTVYVNSSTDSSIVEIKLAREFIDDVQGIITLNRITGQVSAQLQTQE